MLLDYKFDKYIIIQQDFSLISCLIVVAYAECVRRFLPFRLLPLR